MLKQSTTRSEFHPSLYTKAKQLACNNKHFQTHSLLILLVNYVLSTQPFRIQDSLSVNTWPTKGREPEGFEGIPPFLVVSVYGIFKQLYSA